MHRRLFLAAAAAGGFARDSHGAAAAAPLDIMATFSVLGDLTRQVGGDAVRVQTLVGPDGDVHEYQPSPQDLRRLIQARMLVRNGLGLEGWLDRLTGAAEFKGEVVVATAHVTPHTMKAKSGAIATDPHAWQDPRNGILYVAAIVQGLAAIDPVNASTYQATAKRFSDRIAAMDRWIAAQYEPLAPQRRRIITTHDAFGYYGSRYGIEFLAAEGLSTEDEPSAKQIAALVAQIKREHVHAVFIENMTSPRLAQMLAHETGARLGGVVYSDALSPPGQPAATYLDMLKHNTTLFAAALASA